MPSDVMQEARATIVVVDDKELRRAAVVSFLMPWAGAMDAAVEAVERIGDVPAEQLAQARLVVVNVGGERCGDAAVREALQAVREAASEVGVAVLADSGRTEDMVAAFQIGADGYVPTSTEPRIALQALGFIAAGGQFFPPTALVAATAARSGERVEGGRSDALTNRQREVLKLLREGKPNKVIARELDMQEATVKVHVRQIMRKLGVSNRTQAALASAHEAGLSQASEAAADPVEEEPADRRGEPPAGKSAAAQGPLQTGLSAHRAPSLTVPVRPLSA